MSDDLPYMPAVGNVAAILEKIRGAGTPPKFTGEFVKSTLGFTSSQDRTFPRMLRQLRFINADGVPLPRYNEFKASSSGGRAMAAGLREGWGPIFLADQNAQARSAAELTDIFKTVTGQSEAVARKMATTFKAFASHADWSADVKVPSEPERTVERHASAPADPEPQLRDAMASLSLHHDIHLHLPPTSDVSVYRAIFQALRDELL